MEGSSSCWRSSSASCGAGTPSLGAAEPALALRLSLPKYSVPPPASAIASSSSSSESSSPRVVRSAAGSWNGETVEPWKGNEAEEWTVLVPRRASRDMREHGGDMAVGGREPGFSRERKSIAVAGLQPAHWGASSGV